MLRVRHGCRLLAQAMGALWATQAPGATGDFPIVNSRLLDLTYDVPNTAQPLTRVELWFAVSGEPWQRYGVDEDASSPVRFHARRDGLHEFFFVLENRLGASSGPPQPGQPPHQKVLIDTVPPLVQVKNVQLVEDAPSRRRWLAVSWTAYDPNLAERPVCLYYQTRERPGWQGMGVALLNSGRFDWLLPPQLSGELEVRLDVSDRAGNVGAAISKSVRIPSLTVATESVPRPDPAATVASDVQGQTDSPDAARRARAKELYEQGLFHVQHGDHYLAATRLIEAMNTDPTLVAAGSELARIYYAEGEFHSAFDIYQDIIARVPDDRDTLRGSALALVALRRYPEALERLEHVLAGLPNDAETWLDTGDVFVWMGRTEQARQYWNKTLELSEAKSPLRRKAERRLQATRSPDR